jgi:hypothetical protein
MRSWLDFGWGYTLREASCWKNERDWRAKRKKGAGGEELAGLALIKHAFVHRLAQENVELIRLLVFVKTVAGFGDRQPELKSIPRKVLGTWSYLSLISPAQGLIRR